MTAQPDPDRQALAGEYVLGTLPLGARRELEAALAHDPALRTAVAQWEARLLPLTALVGPEQPSPQLWPRIAASLATKASAGSVAQRGGWWDSLILWRGLAAAGLAAALVLSLPLLRPETSPPPRYMVVLAAPGNMAPGWVLRSQGDGGIQLVPLRPTAVPPARAMQLWTKADGWSGPVSLGLVEPGKTVIVSLRGLPPLQPNQLFEITLEPPSGSPLKRPTGPILFIGRAVELI